MTAPELTYPIGTPLTIKLQDGKFVPVVAIMIAPALVGMDGILTTDNAMPTTGGASGPSTNGSNISAAVSNWPSDYSRDATVQAVVTALTTGNLSVIDLTTEQKLEAIRLLLAASNFSHDPAMDINLSALRDSLRGGSARTITDVVNILTSGPVPVSGVVSATIQNQISGYAQDTSVAPLHGDLQTLHADAATLHTDIGATNTALGAQADAVAATDTGTASGLSLWKRLCQIGSNILTLITARLPTGLSTTANGLKVDIGSGTQAVNGSVAVTNFPATQPVSGTFFQTTQPVSVASPLAVTGTFWQATQPVSNASLTSLDTKLPAQGQALAGASLPVVLPATQIASLTPPAAQTHVSLDAGTNIVGKLGIDQTTNGTTNRVNIGSDGTVAVSNFPSSLSANGGVKTEDQWAVYTPFPFGAAGVVVPAGSGVNAGKSIEVGAVFYHGIGTVTIKDGAGNTLDGGRGLSVFAELFLPPTNGWKWFTGAAGQNIQVTAAVLGLVTSPSVSGTMWARYV